MSVLFVDTFVTGITVMVDTPEGVAFILDIHADDRSPSSRVDDYPETVLHKLKLALEDASDNNLLSIWGGDVFNRPHIQSDYIKARIMALCQTAKYKPLVIPGNHDMSGEILGPSDTLWLLGISGCVKLITSSKPWGVFDMRRGDEIIRVGLGGTPFGQDVPTTLPWNEHVDLGLWATHDNFRFQSHYEDKKSYDFHAIPGVDMVVNGHLHHASALVEAVSDDGHVTTWMNPGSLARTKSNEKNRIPSVFFIHTDGSTRTHAIHVDGEASVFSSSSGRASLTTQNTGGAKAEEEGRNRFTNMLSNNFIDEKSVGELLDQAASEGKINPGMRNWLEQIALQADQRK